MIVFFALAGLIPVVWSVGIVCWAKWIRNDPESGTVARGVAIGFAAGIALGAVVGLGLLGLVMVLARSAGR
jgi:hypothetical protein